MSFMVIPQWRINWKKKDDTQYSTEKELLVNEEDLEAVFRTLLKSKAEQITIHKRDT